MQPTFNDGMGCMILTISNERKVTVRPISTQVNPQIDQMIWIELITKRYPGYMLVSFITNLDVQLATEYLGIKL